MALGVVNNTVRLEEYNYEWPNMAKNLIEEIKNIMGNDAIDIQHVGSTSIIGIPAKPIIDVAVAVEELDIYKKYIDIFEENDIHFLGELVEGQRMFCKSTKGCDDRTHHVHFVNVDSFRWTDYQNMRDYCNAHPKVADEYGKLKSELASKYSNMRAMYRKSKKAFIEETLENAKEWRESLTKELTDDFKENVYEIMNKNLMTMSRTAHGVLDLTASKTKADAMQTISGEEAADISKRNFKNAIDTIIKEVDCEFKNPCELREFIERIAAIVNKDIVKEGHLYRFGADSETKTYTLISNLENDVEWFYEQLFNRINSKIYNPVETAAFTEYFMNMRIHMWADGCGKTSMILAAFMMIRGRCLPAKYKDRSEYYSHDSSHRLECNCDEDKKCYVDFWKYYRTQC